jgi:hypothetical protein
LAKLSSFLIWSNTFTPSFDLSHANISCSTARNTRIGFSRSSAEKDRLLLSCLVALHWQDITHSFESVSALKRQTILLLQVLPLHSPLDRQVIPGRRFSLSIPVNILQEVQPFRLSKHREWATPSRSLRNHLIAFVSSRHAVLGALQLRCRPPPKIPFHLYQPEDSFWVCLEDD